MNIKYILIGFLSLFFAGCSENQDALTRISDLEADLKTTRNQTTQLASRLLDVQVAMRSKLESETAAVVDPSSKGYSIARNEFGAFPVVIDDVQPYLDGHKVKFGVANLTSGTMTDVKLEIICGRRYPDIPARDDSQSAEDRINAFQQYFATVEEIKKSQRSLTISGDKDIAPASWNTYEAIIAPSKPEDLGRIEVNVKILGIKLPTDR